MANVIEEEYWVRAVQDRDVIRSESNIIGLHIEADTMDQFHEAVLEIAPELIIANHLGGSTNRRGQRVACHNHPLSLDSSSPESIP